MTINKIIVTTKIIIYFSIVIEFNTKMLFSNRNVEFLNSTFFSLIAISQS